MNPKQRRENIQTIFLKGLKQIRVACDAELTRMHISSLSHSLILLTLEIVKIAEILKNTEIMKFCNGWKILCYELKEFKTLSKFSRRANI